MKRSRSPAPRRQWETERAERLHLSYPVRATMTLRGTNETAIIDDVSATGLGLSSMLPLPVGALLDLQLHDAGLASTRPVQATVRHATPRAGGWLIGCKLDMPLSPEELQGVTG